MAEVNNEKQYEELQARLALLEAKNEELSQRLDENTQETRLIREDTSKLVLILESWHGAIRVLEGIGRIFRPLGYIALFCSGVAGAVAAIKNGVVPK